MGTPEEVMRNVFEETMRKVFEETFKQIWTEASTIIITILILLVICEVIAIWIEWKFYAPKLWRLKLLLHCH